jgi:hypothetical protein
MPVVPVREARSLTLMRVFRSPNMQGPNLAAMLLEFGGTMPREPSRIVRFTSGRAIAVSQRGPD